MPVDISAFKLIRVELKRPLLLLLGAKGTLACAYLDPGTFEKTGEAVAIVSGVSDADDMRKAVVSAVSSAARVLGVLPGMTGEEALSLFR